VRRSRRALLCSALTPALAVVGVFAGPAALSSAAPLSWSQAVEIEAPTGTSQHFELNGVACSAVGSCSAVGDYESTLVDAAATTETSGKWSQAAEVEPPEPAGVAALTSVSCASPGNCVAAGYYSYNEDGEFAPMIATETGGVWAKAEAVELPANAAVEKDFLGQSSLLGSIACDPAGSCTAGGEYFLESPREQVAMTVTKSGGKWKATELQATAHADAADGAELSSISCPASGECMAVGGYRSESDGLQALVTAGEAGGVFATPTELAVPHGAVEFASGGLPLISCPASGSCLTIDPYKAEGGQDESYVATSSGGVWGAAVELPETGELLGAACPQTGACAAVGLSGQAIAASGIGTSWSASSPITLPTGADTSTESRLTSVSCPAEGSCVAVGDYATGSRLRQGMVTYGTGSSTEVCPATSSTCGGPLKYEKPVEGKKETPSTVTTTTATGTPSPLTGNVTVSSANLTVKANGQTGIKLTCTGTAACSGTLTLTAKAKGKGKKKAKTEDIGTASFSISAGMTATIKLTLNATGKALLKAAHGRLSATLEIVKSSSSPVATQHETVQLEQKTGKKSKG
jgi:hypothetical protein